MTPSCAYIPALPQHQHASVLQKHGCNPHQQCADNTRTSRTCSGYRLNTKSTRSGRCGCDVPSGGSPNRWESARWWTGVVGVLYRDEVGSQWRRRDAFLAKEIGEIETDRRALLRRVEVRKCNREREGSLCLREKHKDIAVWKVALWRAWLTIGCAVDLSWNCVRIKHSIAVYWTMLTLGFAA